MISSQILPILLTMVLCLGCRCQVVETLQKAVHFDLANTTVFSQPWPPSMGVPLCSYSTTDANIASAEAAPCDNQYALNTTGYSFPSRCFRVSFIEFGAVRVSLACVQPTTAAPDVFHFTVDVTRVNHPPVCAPLSEVRVPYGDTLGGAAFLLRATDVDGDERTDLTFEILNDTLATLRGYLTYCDNCSADAATDNQWRNLSTILHDPSSAATFSGMFGYHPPAGSPVGFTETVSFVAEDLMNEQCDPPGQVAFTVTRSAPPRITSPVAMHTHHLTTGIPETLRINAASDDASSLFFTLVAAPDPACAVVCPVPVPVVRSLTYAPGQVFSGPEVDCAVTSSYVNHTDITLVSTLGTFFFATVFVVKPLTKPCTTRLAVAATDGISTSALTWITVSVEQQYQGQCSSLQLALISLSSPLSFRASDVFDAPVPMRWSFLGWVDPAGYGHPVSASENRLVVTRTEKALQPEFSLILPNDTLQLEPSSLESRDAILLIGTVSDEGDEASLLSKCKISVKAASEMDDGSAKQVMLLTLLAVLVVAGAIWNWRRFSANGGTQHNPYKAVRGSREPQDVEMQGGCPEAPTSRPVRWKDRKTSGDDSVIVTTGGGTRSAAGLARRDQKCAEENDDDEFSSANQPASSLGS